MDGGHSGVICAKEQGSGEKATAECIANAIADNRAELVHLPSSMDLNMPLPSKDCPTCDGTGVMSCPECKNKLQVRISADDIMEPPWQAYNVLSKMEYPYEASIIPPLCF
ncbi:EMBRYO DEFECTIVE 2737 [Salix purpurea]|uniref:EMBRYO DEFECTIVE 2737 n=1 Tax=Salix purpurea TaxID=77065 RepID=A0A9Q0WQQ6_SALPP|nr:EMBRYO DEFECTIVE 2737 [Salix purpurea]